MKFTLSWLKDHLDTDASLETISETLTVTGLEVEGIEDPAEIYAPFVIGHVLSAEKHPDADKLQVLSVDVGGEKPLQVVCGAPNARAGMKGAFAPIGTTMPKADPSEADFTLKPTKIRGVESFGMMCSERELLLSEDHKGVIDLETDAAAGTAYSDVAGLNDPVIEIAITPNRPDALGVRGIARDLAAAGLGTLKPDNVVPLAGEGACAQDIALEFSADDGYICPVFAGRIISGVSNEPSPEWLQKRLTAVGLRPINALVDITNYISYDRGRPLHVYDADKLKGVIHARLAKKGESFTGLDEKDYKLDDNICVIADDNGALGMGGIMGGLSTGCTEETKNVFIESAWFDPIHIAMTGRKLQLSTDARYRFERGVDPLSVQSGLDQATQMALELCGGTASEVKKAGAEPRRDLVIDFPAGPEVMRLTGKDVGAPEVVRILTDLGFVCTPKSDGIYAVDVPSWRPDINGSADLVEEIVRIIGIDTIPAVALPRMNGVARPVLTHGQKQLRKARATQVSRGLVEAITWSFIPKEQAVMFGGGAAELTLSNPISIEMSNMRPSLLPGILAAAKRNKDRGHNDSALFEVGNIYHSDQPDGQTSTTVALRTGTCAMTGHGRFWDGSTKNVDVFDAKADAFAVLSALGVNVDNVQITRDAPEWFHPGRSGAIKLGPKMVLGYFGELHPTILKSFGLNGAVAVSDIFLSNLPQPKKKASRARAALEITDLQSITKDFAFLLNKDVPAGDIIKAAAGADKKLISQVTVFDIFEGDSIGADKKSVAIEITLQPKQKTLTDKDIEGVMNKVITAVEKKTGGELRG